MHPQFIQFVMYAFHISIYVIHPLVYNVFHPPILRKGSISVSVVVPFILL